MLRKCAMFHCKGRAYRFGFGQSWFTGKVPERKMWRAVAVVVVGREGVGVGFVSCKSGRFVWREECSHEKVWVICVVEYCKSAGAICLPAQLGGEQKPSPYEIVIDCVFRPFIRLQKRALYLQGNL